jgi:tripartite-type tricarboxylate transporter receptor subunit TctC
VEKAIRNPIRAALALLALALLPAPAWCQAAYPNRPIRMIVPFAPGGASDVVARIISPKLGEILGQSIIIDNRAGASGNIGMDAAARAAPDGYTIFMGNIGTMAINPAIFRDLTVNPRQDFTAVTQVVDVPSVLIANSTVPVNSVAELIAFGKANPGTLNFASTGSGALSRLEMEQLRKTAGLDVVHIPYRGGAGPAVTGMLGGEVHVMFVTLASVMAQIQAGKLKALGVSTAKRLDALPQVPTMAESGFPEMVSGAWQGVFVPAGTPRAIVDKLHAALVTVLGSPETRQRLAAAAAPPVASRTPEEFAAFVDAEATRWGKVARDARATVD